MTSMREKIARAIDPHAFKSWQQSYDYEMGQSGDETEAKAFADWAHSTAPAFERADAVLDAMEKWTPEMHEAGLHKFVEMHGRAPSTQLLNSYAAMIRAARPKP